MFGKVLRSLCRDRRGRSLVAGAISVLAGVEALLSSRTPQAAASELLPGPASQPEPAIKRRPCMKIRQTKSELGYVYWVLQDCRGATTYALFDTWREAMDEA